MKLQRPQIKADDNYLTRIIKYIPAEIITVYTAIVGLFVENKELISNGIKSTQLVAPNNMLMTYYFTLLFIIVVTPVWTYLSVYDNPNVPEPPTKTKRAIFHSCIATVSFIVWIYAVGDRMFIALLNSWSYSYNSKFASVMLILFTVLIVPLLEKLILQEPRPQPKP